MKLVELQYVQHFLFELGKQINENDLRPIVMFNGHPIACDFYQSSKQVTADGKQEEPSLLEEVDKIQFFDMDTFFKTFKSAFKKTIHTSGDLIGNIKIRENKDICIEINVLVNKFLNELKNENAVLVPTRFLRNVVFLDGFASGRIKYINLSESDIHEDSFKLISIVKNGEFVPWK